MNDTFEARDLFPVGYTGMRFSTTPTERSPPLRTRQ